MHRRIATALRAIGEGRADRSGTAGQSPRWRVASLVAATELAAATLGVAAAGSDAVSPRTDQHPATVAAVMYAAPTVPALLGRLEQDRRLLTSLARTLAGRLDEIASTPWGHLPLRQVVTTVAVVEAARCAVALEQVAASADV